MSKLFGLLTLMMVVAAVPPFAGERTITFAVDT
jgi:hypothetical protein